MAINFSKKQVTVFAQKGQENKLDWEHIHSFNNFLYTLRKFNIANALDIDVICDPLYEYKFKVKWKYE